MLKRFHPLFINTHFNHPDELTPAAVAALGMLADAGIPLGCQTVLLKGVNDDPAVMKELMQRLLMARVRPYYIYMADQVAGAEHFRTTVQTGIKIMEALRGWTSGLANPHFVIDAPGGGGKIPLLPEYVISMSDDEVVLRNFRGQQLRLPAAAGGGRSHQSQEGAEAGDQAETQDGLSGAIAAGARPRPHGRGRSIPGRGRCSRLQAARGAGGRGHCNDPATGPPAPATAHSRRAMCA